MEVEGAVVVITGASSGIGRCTALALARQGARLVLAARNKKALEQAARECRRAGADAAAVECDVSEEEDVQELAERAVEEFGRIDAWINNAGVGLYGRFEDIPSRSFRQQFETLWFGVVHGARAALKQFRRQGGRGLLIDVSSQVATGGIPYQAGYGAAKYAIRMFDDTLRQELQETPEIQVCTVLPSSTDTPFFEHAGNYTGREITPVGSVSRPEEVAEAIVKLIEQPEREVLIGKHGYLMGAAHALAPNVYNRAIRKYTDRKHFGSGEAEVSDGSVFEPQTPAQIHGGWRKRGGGARVSKFAAIAGVATLGALLARRVRTGAGSEIREAA